MTFDAKERARNVVHHLTKDALVTYAFTRVAENLVASALRDAHAAAWDLCRETAAKIVESEFGLCGMEPQIPRHALTCRCRQCRGRRLAGEIRALLPPSDPGEEINR